MLEMLKIFSKIIPKHTLSDLDPLLKIVLKHNFENSYYLKTNL